MTYKRKKYHHGDTHLKKRWRLRNRKKDLDQIDVDIKEGMMLSRGNNIEVISLCCPIFFGYG